jgi:hypothetical protein
LSGSSEVLTPRKPLVDLTAAEVTEVNEQATEVAIEATAGEYWSCLFFLLTDNERFKSLETQLDNTFLMGKHKYRRNILQSKNIFVLTIRTTTKQQREQMDPADVVIAEREERQFPTCFTCRKNYLLGYTYCPNVSKTVRDRIIEQVKAGNFCTQQYGDGITISKKARSMATSNITSSKKGGGVFVVVDKESHEKEKEEELPLPS